MAISAVFRHLVRSMREHNVLPQAGALLEIGEANWYGPVDYAELQADIDKFVTDPERRAALSRRVEQLPRDDQEIIIFNAVKVFYDIFFAPCEVQAIDYGGTPAALRLDLNEPVTLSRRFNVIINHGTAEHVFNIAQVFRTMHDWTVPGGMMIHESPFTGWIDHGFYNLQPTLFVDVAEYNGYQILGLFVEDIANNVLFQVQKREDVYEMAKQKSFPENALLFVVFSKGPIDQPFRVPIQGYYRESLSESGMKAWSELR
ncbi:MAG: hypothetical protein AB7O59_09925 [Pirellulales bacterium]